MSSRKPDIVGTIAFAVYLALVAYLCFGHFDSLPSVPRSIFGIPSDKVVHFLMFVPFVPLAYIAFVGDRRRPWVTIAAIVGIFMAGCGIAALTEIIQGLISYRSKDLADFRADSFSMAIAALVVFIHYLFKRNKNAPDS